MPTFRVVVRGEVQGVGFRWFARESARRGNLAGWVRNLPDGSVEAAVSGDDAAVERFLAALRRGPSGSRVDGVETHALDEVLERPFTIRR